VPDGENPACVGEAFKSEMCARLGNPQSLVKHVTIRGILEDIKELPGVTQVHRALCTRVLEWIR